MYACAQTMQQGEGNSSIENEGCLFSVAAAITPFPTNDVGNAKKLAVAADYILFKLPSEECMIASEAIMKTTDWNNNQTDREGDTEAYYNDPKSEIGPVKERYMFVLVEQKIDASLKDHFSYVKAESWEENCTLKTSWIAAEPSQKGKKGVKKGKRRTKSGDATNNSVLETIQSEISEHDKTLSCCEVCGKRVSKMELHMKLHEKGKTSTEEQLPVTQPDTHVCKLCGKRVIRVDRHMNWHAENDLYFNPDAEYVPDLTKGRQRCKICGKMRRYLEKHMKMHSQENPVCEFCGKTMKTQRSLEKHKKIHIEKDTIKVCSICGISVKGLKEHMLRHTGLRPYACEQCGSKFITNCELIKHRRIHSNEKKYLCPLCGNKFASSSVLSTHLRRHSGEKAHQCQICQAKFFSGHALKEHMARHSEKKIFPCSKCPRKFTKPINLKDHMLTHGERPSFRCCTCRAEFTVKQEFKEHRQSHKNLSCHLCGKKYSTNKWLNIHLLAHNGVKPYPCNICCKAFQSETNLAVHQLSHKYQG